MCKALIYLHSKNIIHRDIKPENILVDGDNLKLADFGWSIHTPKNKRSTFCGTMDYISPEMIKEKYSNSIDVWSIGVLTYELCSGFAPFHAKKDQETFNNIKKINYVMKSHFSDELKDFIAKILKKNPAERMSLEEALEHTWIKQYERENLEPESQDIDMEY